MTTVQDYTDSIRQSIDEIVAGTDPTYEPGDNLREWLEKIDQIAKQASKVYGLKE